MKYLLIFLAGCLVSQPALSRDTQIAIPENASIAWVSDNINQDGMLLSIQTFNSDESVDSVLEFYREQWFKEGEMPGYVENTLEEWSIISQLREKTNVVLQLKSREDGATEGFLSTAKLNHGGVPPKVDFPTPDGTEKFSSTYTEEDDAQVLTMTFISKQSTGNAAVFYRNRLARKGWKLAREEDVDGSQIMLFNRKADRCELVISQLDSESTVIHVNRVKRNG